MRISTLLIPAMTLALVSSAYSQNNTPDTAAPINTSGSFAFDTGPFTTSGFNGGGSCAGGASSINQDGFWQWTAPANGDYTFDTLNSNYDTKLSVHLGVGSAATCADYNDDTFGLLSEVSLDGLAAGDTVLIQIGGFGSDSGTGSMNITHFVDPCDGVPDDAFEDNDDCASATVIGNGANTGLFVTRSDPDFYTFCVAAGASVQIDLLFTSVQGNVDAFLREASSPNCGNGAGAGILVQGFTATDNEAMTWVNTTGGDADVVLEVNINAFSATNCNQYDLVIAGAEGCGGGGSTGLLFCNPSTPNSTGNPTILAGSFGSGVGSGLHLECLDGVPGEFGYYLAGNMATPGIPVSQGKLCLLGVPGATLFRFNIAGTPASSISQFDASGVMQNLAGTSQVGSGFDVPSAMQTVVIMPGETWHFQAWHRDTGAGVGESNFSNGISVTF
ncbi:MAG: hypothetical protein JKY61_12000 [Planctomycetes bacterium]|nr:hypothetical protein [Planctomycetota bacterium]